MRLYLETPNVPDEVLIREMNVAMVTESARSKTVGTKRHPARQNQKTVLCAEVSDKQNQSKKKLRRQIST